MSRKHKSKPSAPPPNRPPAPEVQLEQVKAALQQDNGPVMVTVGVNPVTGKLALATANTNSEQSLRLAKAGLQMALAEVDAAIERLIAERAAQPRDAASAPPAP